MSKQTAIEWLVKSLVDVGLDYVLGQHNDLIVQAKAMERQQIIDAWIHPADNELQKMAAQQYFNETFGGEE